MLKRPLFPREASAQHVALAASLVLHLLVLLWFTGHGPLKDGGAVERFTASSKSLQVRLLNPPLAPNPAEPVDDTIEDIASPPTALLDPQAAAAVASNSASTAAAPSELPASSRGALEQMGTIIDLGSGLELAASTWMGAQLISPPLTVAVTINPSGFIDAWEITPAFDLSQIPAGSIEFLIRRIPVKRTGETHISVYEFILGTREEKPIANLYLPAK